MVSIEEAQRAILSEIAPLETVKVSVFEGLNRVTPESHIAPWDIPPADNSAMDGYAFSHASFKDDRLKVTGFLPAGEVCKVPVLPGEAIKIMTGAPLPPSCDTVVPVEDVEEDGAWIRVTSSVKAGSHVRERGEDIRHGDVVIPEGSLLRPQEIGMLSAMGTTSVAVYRKARVAILSTGDELLEPGSTPLPGKIINSNSYSLAAQVLDAGGDPMMLGIAADTLEDTCDKIKAGLNADMLVITGGVSVGDRDFVKVAIEKLGGEVIFWKVNMKPGKPLAFAMLQGKPVFALPGNPVAAMVSFELFVRPSILKAMGHDKVFRPKAKAAMKGPVSNKGKRPHLVRGIVSKSDDRYHVSTTGNQSSGRLSSLIQGNGLILLEPESSRAAGDSVDVLLLDRGFEMGSFR
ncbi:molybdopterin molybdotransferase MoeA [Geomonas subterranea]|uniref:Molybdopterin molybdenumtransferase n=1 Tax=Geomonas subterranea TaxID=2847989 RepID=A0ABX8LPI0_9BACT|nr:MULTISPECIES: gephyrin-like molybdotransferase Glp [Geomonas]QXE91425.1 molybdopterin molybdotransferase MoeA [Geomonas subterranea]QXM10487.1 molybdopterin molybdotransferase MoeA [Geomonas subterranea]